MHAETNTRLRIGLGLTTAMAAVLLSGCAGNLAPRAEVSASNATAEMARGRHDRAIEHAEAAALGEPQNAAYRVLLGNAYLDGGRFASAETAFNDAMTLGDTSPRVALALALAQIAQAKYAPALQVLNEYDGQIASADQGLALALAGQPERGIHVMSNAIRGGENTVKMRQNLAYAYAMAGRWREARLMASQDVPAGEVGQRMEQWAAMAPSEAYQHRVANLIGAPVGVPDMGQPAHLALGSNPSVEALMAEAARPSSANPVAANPAAADPAIRSGELAPVASAMAAAQPATPLPAIASQPPSRAPGALAPLPARASAPQDFASAFAPAEPAANARRYVSEPVVQPIPGAQTAAATPARNASASGTHLVQLGSFLSEAGARRAWEIYQNRYPELADRDLVITQAVVRGRNYWRVSAAGYSQNASRSMCARVRSSGANCATWAEGRPLPGAVDNGVRLARR